MADSGVLTDGSKILNDILNAADKLYLTNQESSSAVTGDVLVLDVDNDESFIFGVDTYDTRPVFVVPSDIDLDGTASTLTIAAAGTNWVYKAPGYVPLATVDDAVDIGEYLVLSSTSKKLTGTDVLADSSGIRPTNAKAIALEAAAGAGQIAVMLLPLHGITARRARVYNSSTINLTQNDLTLMTFDSERYDDYGMHEGVTNPGRLTVPSDLVGNAIFKISAHITTTNSLNGFYVIIRLNGSDIIAKENRDNTIGVQISIATLYELTAGDYVEVLCYTTDASKVVNAEANWSPEFAIAQIGEGYLA